MGAIGRRLVPVAALALSWAAAAAGENGQSGAALPANEWVKLEEGGLGEREGAALLYVPAIGRFLAAMGIQTRYDRQPVPPYSEMTFNFEKRRWENALPEGKEAWGQPTGPVEAPKFKDLQGRRLARDAEANLRPNLRATYGTYVHHQYAYDGDRKKALYGSDMEYDPVKRAWTLLETKGHPGTPDLPPLEFKAGTREGPAWSQTCYDPVNREFLLFGGTKTVTETGAPGTWAYSPEQNEWRRLAFGSETMNGLQKEAERLRLRAHAAVTACRNRYYAAETPENARRRLSELAGEILKAADLEALSAKAKEALAGAKGYEKTQLERAGPELAAALAGHRKLLAEADAPLNAEKIAAAGQVEARLRRAAESLCSEPPPRCYSPMAYDGQSRRIVLFGGSALTRALADTWLYDPATRSWEERRPELSPSPRLGHGLVFLPKSKKVVLVGGWRGVYTVGCNSFYGESLVPEAWQYDVAADKWTLLKQWGKEHNKGGAAFPPPGNNPQVFAVDENDVVLTVAGGGKSPATWACRMDPVATDPAGTAKAGVGPGAEHHPLECTPEWYDARAPAPDAKAVEAELKALPVNRWVRRPAGGVLRPTNAYCTVAFDSDRDEIVTFVGGHATWHGADVARYSLSADRWHTDHRAQPPLSFGYFASGGSYGYGFRPWLGVHTWGGYAYDPAIRKLVVLTGMHSFTHVFDPDAGEFERPKVRLPPEGEGWTTGTCSTPQGICAWIGVSDAPAALWRLEDGGAAWRRLPVKGGKLPRPGTDASSLAYDSRRDRLLIMPADAKGDLLAYDLRSGELSRLEAGGRENAPGNYRECEYCASRDMLVELMGSAYDIAKNAWVKLPVDTSELAKGSKAQPRAADNTQGMVYDPKRDLFWAVNGYWNKGVFVLRLGAAGAREDKP
jgi:hypothetical protein